jgi:hypothetical protein
MDSSERRRRWALTQWARARKRYALQMRAPRTTRRRVGEAALAGTCVLCVVLLGAVRSRQAVPLGNCEECAASAVRGRGAAGAKAGASYGYSLPDGYKENEAVYFDEYVFPARGPRDGSRWRTATRLLAAESK